MMRYGLGPDWKSSLTIRFFSLGICCNATWNRIDEKTWDAIPFASAWKSDIEKILSYGEGVSPGKNTDQAAVGEIRKILLALV
jgi:hypothetical protein